MYLSKDESVLCSGSHDMTVRLWDGSGRVRGSVMTLSDARDDITAVEVEGEQVLTRFG